MGIEAEEGERTGLGGSHGSSAVSGHRVGGGGGGDNREDRGWRVVDAQVRKDKDDKKGGRLTSSHSASIRLVLSRD